MRRLSGLMALASVGGIAGCGASGAITNTHTVTRTINARHHAASIPKLPDLTNEKLDVAESDAEEAHVRVKVVGGGTFGVLDPSNWMVCEQRPAAGTRATRVRLIVERECE